MGFSSLLPLFWEEFSRFLDSWFKKNIFLDGVFGVSRILSPVKKTSGSVGSGSENSGLMDLPDLAVESILEKLSPAELRSMAGVCRALREKCVADHLWEKKLEKRWGNWIGNAALREWKSHGAARKRATSLKARIKDFLLNVKSPEARKSRNVLKGCLTEDSVMALFFSLETGGFWFPAQVYNRENGNVGFLLSCYDAEVSYAGCSGLFCARYSSPDGRCSMEESIVLDRLRAAPVATQPYELHKSDCLRDLKPNDHIEIQWRRSKEFPYGWWYGVVGHLDSCKGKFYCNCHKNDTVKLEFRQYSPDSEWRETAINRKRHEEVGNEGEGYYGGIRKLYSEDDISVWQRFWPTCILD